MTRNTGLSAALSKTVYWYLNFMMDVCHCQSAAFLMNECTRKMRTGMELLSLIIPDLSCIPNSRNPGMETDLYETAHDAVFFFMKGERSYEK